MTTTHFGTATFEFDGPGTQEGYVEFSKGSTVLGATAVLQGFFGTYGNTKDHNMRTLEVQVSPVTKQNNFFKYLVTFRLDDKSNHDMYGTVTVATIASVEE